VVRWSFTEEVHIEKRRVVVRSDAVGAAEFRSTSSLRQRRRLAADGAVRPTLPRRRAQLERRRASAAASRLPSRDLRPAGRVLARRRRSAADLPRDPHVPDAQEHGLQADRRAVEPVRRTDVGER